MIKQLKWFNAVVDLEGVQEVRLNPPSGTKLFKFHEEMYEKPGKKLKTYPLLMDLNPPSRNPGYAPAMIKHLKWFNDQTVEMV